MQPGDCLQYPDSSLETAARSRAGCVLIVDDERPLRRGLRRLVEQAGHSVLEAGSIAEARNQLQTGAVDVVLLDLHLPDANGLSLLGDAALSARDIAVIVFTGSSARSDMQACLAGGVASYLHKSAYKSAWSSERIQGFFREGSGTQFERKIVDALFDCLPQLQQLAQEWPEYASSPALQAHPGLVASSG